MGNGPDRITGEAGLPGRCPKDSAHPEPVKKSGVTTHMTEILTTSSYFTQPEMTHCEIESISYIPRNSINNESIRIYTRPKHAPLEDWFNDAHLLYPTLQPPEHIYAYS